jgi:DNA-binding beta-propeller fold protein YncE
VHVLTVSRLANAVRQLLAVLAGVVAHPFGGSSAPVFRNGTHGSLLRDLRAPCTVALTLGALLAVAGPASAALVFEPNGTIAGSGGGAFSQLNSESVAVNDSNGHILVADSGVGLVYEFTSAVDSSPATWDGSTTPSGSFGGGRLAVAVDNSSGDVYVLDSTDGVVDKFDATGALIGAFGDSTPSSDGQLHGTGATPAGAFNAPKGITVDQATGELYVLDSGNQVVDIFDSSGAFIASFDGSATSVGSFSPGFADGIAVDDQNNHIFISDSGTVRAFDFASATDPFPVTLDGSNTPAGSFGFGYVSIAADNASGNVYVADTYDSVVDAFDSSGAYLAQITGTPGASLGGLNVAAGVAVDQANGDIYVSDNVTGSVGIFRPLLVPDVSTGAASAVGATTATLNGHLDPAGNGDVTDCHFDYVDDAQFQVDVYASAQTVACAEGNSFSAPADVHAEITGLTADTIYHFRLEASNATGTNVGADATFSTLPRPSIEAISAANITPSAADLTATINPRGSDTSYHFEYGTDTSYGTSVPVPDADIGSGTSGVEVSHHITGLTENTTYHYRLLATNPSGTVGASVDHTFIYDTSGGALPDNRAYEMVTPVQKNGALIGDVSFVGAPPDIAAGGARVIAGSIQCFADATSCNAQHNVGVGSPYAFTRTAAGWVTTALAPPASQFDQNTPWAYVADTGAALFSMPTAPFGEDDLYKRQPDGSFTDIGPLTPPAQGPQGPLGGKVLSSVQAQTADVSQFVWQVPRSLWPFDASATGGSVYEYAGSGNTQPLLVGVSGGPGSTDLISTCGTALGANSNEFPPGILSADGRSVYFTALSAGPGVPCPGGSGANAGTAVPAKAVYARIDGEFPSAHTVAISQRSPADCGVPSGCQSSPPGDAHFQGASADGSRAYFTDTQQLTDTASEDSTAGDSAYQGCPNTTGANGCNLYLYDFGAAAGHELTAVSAGDTSGGGPRVQGVLALSSDGSHIYFVAKGVLAANRDSKGQTAPDGANNLYVYDAASGDTSFVAALPQSDSEAWTGSSSLAANVTPDGRFLVFRSFGRLTPDDSSQSGARQVFRYDAQTGALQRISVGNNGFNDNGNRPAATPCGATACSEDAFIAPPSGGIRRDPTMSDDGATVFFQSPIALTPRGLDDVQTGTDGAGNPIYAQNLYEWHSRHVALISDGTDTSRNAGSDSLCPLAGATGSSVCLLGSDASGQNVFFTTAGQLVPQDTDSELDYYDARVGGGFPYTPPPEPCSGDSCKPPPSGTPPDQVAGSITFVGPADGAPATTRIRLVRKRATRSALILTVSIPAKGRIRVTGAGLKTISKAVSKAGSYRIVVGLTHKEKTLLKRKRKLTLRPKLRFTPSTGSPSSITVPVTVKA